MSPSTSPLVTPGQLARWLSAEACLTVLDVRWEVSTGADHAAYLAGHIPGAVFIDLDRQLADPPSDRGRHPLPDAVRFGGEMRSAGVWNERPVVVYDAAASLAAARAWWLLRYFGHARVAVLDGGFATWVGEGYPVSSAVLTPEPGDFVPQLGGMRAL